MGTLYGAAIVGSELGRDEADERRHDAYESREQSTSDQEDHVLQGIYSLAQLTDPTVEVVQARVDGVLEIVET
jgi:hypothetical protein